MPGPLCRALWPTWRQHLGRPLTIAGTAEKAERRQYAALREEAGPETHVDDGNVTSSLGDGIGDGETDTTVTTLITMKG